MRIAMIGQKGIPVLPGGGGVEAHVQGLAERLVQAGHDVLVYNRQWYTQSTTNIHATHTPHVQMIFTPSLRTKHLDTITHTFTSTLHAIKNKVDVIHYHGGGPALVAWIPRIFAPRIRVIATLHSLDQNHGKWGWFARFILRMGERAVCTFSHEIIVISKSLQDYCWNRFKKETVCIPNGVNTQVENSLLDLGKLFDVIPGEYILTASRLVPCKALHFLIESFILLKKKYPDNPKVARLKLVIAGSGSYTDDYVDRIKRQASVCPDILFVGHQTGSALEALCKNALAFIHPSLNEGLPMAVLTAMSYGIPVFVSNIPEHLELIDDARCLFKAHDVQDCMIALLRACELTENERQEIGRRNQIKVQQEYSWDVIVSKIVEVYRTEGTLTTQPHYSTQ